MVSPSGKYIFSGHESFPCRTLWLKKGYDYLHAGNSFNAPEAVVTLGVGKNMVSAIRFWLKAFGISQNDEVTTLGNYLFNDESGKDKYLEDLASLWLLHYNYLLLFWHNFLFLYMLHFDFLLILFFRWKLFHFYLLDALLWPPTRACSIHSWTSP